MCHALWWEIFFFLRNGLQAGATNTATLLGKKYSLHQEIKAYFNNLGKGKRSILSSVHMFGEMYITTHHNNLCQARFANFGTLGIWVGFTKGHPGGTHHLLNPKTRTLSLTKCVTFFYKSYGEWNNCSSSKL